MVCGSGSLFIRPDTSQASAVYLQAVLSSQQMQVVLEEKSLGVTMANLNSDIVEGLEIPLPPIELQHRYEALLVERRQAMIRAGLSASTLNALFASLQQRAFRGEL